MNTHFYRQNPPKSASAARTARPWPCPARAGALRDAARASRLPLRSTGGCSAAHLETWSAVKVCSSRPTCVPGLSLAARGLARGARQQGPSRAGLLAALAALLRRGAGGRAHRVGGGRRFSARFPLKLHDSLRGTYGLWAARWRVIPGQGVRIENRRPPPASKV